DAVVGFVEATSIAVWSVAGETEVIPRLLGHITILTALMIGVFVVAAILPTRRQPGVLVVPVAAAVVAVLFGAGVWSSLLLTLATISVSFVLTERIARLRVRLLPGTLGGILIGFAIVGAYYPTVEIAAFQERQRVAQDLALRMVLQRLPSPEEF